MTKTKTLKVSDLVYEKINNLKSGNESVDDVLRRELGLVSEDYDIDEDLGAYLSEETREWAKTFAQQLEAINNLTHEIERDQHGVDELRFVHPDAGVSVARLGFSNDDFRLEYRDNQGEWTQICRVDAAGPSEYKDLDEYLEEAERRVKGAIRKWS